MGCVTCEKCGDLLDIDKRIPEHDEGLDAYFCDCECWISWYQKEYDRLITEKERWKRDYLLLRMDMDYLITICNLAIEMNDRGFTRGFLKGALEHVRRLK